MDDKGEFRPDTKWERLTGRTFVKTLKRQAKADIVAMRGIEKVLRRIKDPKVRPPLPLLFCPSAE